MVTKDEYLEWRRNPVTQELLGYLRQQIEEAKDILATEAGLSPGQDRYLVGGVALCVEMLEWHPEYLEINES
jgi:hypothetical protein